MKSNFGSLPITFPRKHDFNELIEYLIEKPPIDYVEPIGDNLMEIRLPFFETKNVQSNFYLSPHRQRIFKKRMRQFFIIKFRGEINQSIIRCIDKKDAIEDFRLKYDLSPDCWDMLEKNYNRYLTVRWKRNQFRKNKSLSVK